MYKLIFDTEELEIKDLASMKIGLASFNGVDAPKYMYLIFKKRYYEKDVLQTYDSLFHRRKLLKIDISNPDSSDWVIPSPDNFIESYFEEGDLIVCYGDPIYADEAS